MELTFAIATRQLWGGTHIEVRVLAGDGAGRIGLDVDHVDVVLLRVVEDPNCRSLQRENLVELMTSDSTLKASREGSK